MYKIIALFVLVTGALGYYLTAGAHTVFLVAYLVLSIVSLLLVWDVDRSERKTKALISEGWARRQASKQKDDYVIDVSVEQGALPSTKTTINERGLTYRADGDTIGYD